MAYNPNEKRVESGPHGGEWTGGDAGNAIRKAASDKKIKLPKGSKIIYHHTDQPIENIKNRDEGTWFTTNEYGAIGAKASGGHTLEMVINPDELNLASNKEFMLLLDKSWTERAKALKESGFDGVKRIVDGDTHYWIFDINKLHKKS